MSTHVETAGSSPPRPPGGRLISDEIARRLAVAAGGFACGILVACGGGVPSAPGPSPPSVTGGFLHVLQDGSVVTYGVDASTGRLRHGPRQVVGDAHTLAGEPNGRYVYAGFGPRSIPPADGGASPSIVSYAPDPSSGSLTKLSEASSQPASPGFRTLASDWHWLAASSSRVYAIWEDITYHDVYPTLVTHSIEGGGRLDPGDIYHLDEYHIEEFALDAGSDVFYKVRWGGPMTASVVTPDGRLTSVGESRLCGTVRFEVTRPLVAVRGFLFAYGNLPTHESTVCSWAGSGLAPRSNQEVRSSYAVAVAPRGASGSSASSAVTGTLVAMRIELPYVAPGHSTTYEIRLFAMSDDGDLAPLDSVTGSGYARRLLFHPSGRFLYLSHGGVPESLTVYSIDAQGRFALVETVEGGGGPMAVTLR